MGRKRETNLFRSKQPGFFLSNFIHVFLFYSFHLFIYLFIFLFIYLFIFFFFFFFFFFFVNGKLYFKIKLHLM